MARSRSDDISVVLGQKTSPSPVLALDCSKLQLANPSDQHHPYLICLLTTLTITVASQVSFASELRLVSTGDIISFYHSNCTFDDSAILIPHLHRRLSDSTPHLHRRLIRPKIQRRPGLAKANTSATHFPIS